MRDYGIVRSRFWAWAKDRALSMPARELALYCLTCPHTVGTGCFRLPIAYIADDLGTVPDTVRQTISELSRIGFLRHDEKSGWVWIVGFLDHNPIANPNVGKSLAPFVEAIPEKLPFFKDFIEALRPHANRFPNGFIDGQVNRIPNCMPNHDQEHEHEQEARPSSTTTTAAASAACADAQDTLDLPDFLDAQVTEAVKIYNETAARVGWARVQKFDADRKAPLKARLRECGGIEGWKAAMAKAEASSFLTGKTGRTDGHENWRPDFDFFVKPKRFTKLMEGGFDDAPDSAKPARKPGIADTVANFAEAAARG